MRTDNVVLTAAICAALCLFSSCKRSTVYQPSKTILRTPADAGLSYEDVSLATQDGVRLHAWYVPRESARATVLLCHGSAGNMSEGVETARVLTALRTNVLLFDYRGYGKSEGTPSERGTYLDSLAAWDYLTQERGEDPSRIVVHGRSMGGAIAARLSAEKGPAGVILESTFTSIPDMAEVMAGSFGPALDCAEKYDAMASCARLWRPVLVIHSRQDEAVPYSMGRRLYDIIPAAYKQFVDISGSHEAGWMDSLRAYTSGLSSFLDRVLAPAGPSRKAMP